MMKIPHARAALQRRSMFWVAAVLVWACGGSLTDTTGGSDIATIAVNPPAGSVTIGGQLPLQAVATGTDGKVVASPTIVWTVRDSSIAIVSSSGIVEGRTVGSTEVAASANGKSGVAVITVQKPAVSSVVVTPGQVDAVTGVRTQLTVVVLDADHHPLADRTVLWSSSAPTVATVDSTGEVTPIAAGFATITATVEGQTGSASITVTQAPIATLSITPNPLSMSVGQTTQLTAVAVDQSGNVLSGRATNWSSSDADVASVSDAGVVTAVVAGTATITATSEDKSATASVTISNFGVRDVSIQPTTTTIVERSSTQLSAVVHDVTGAIVTGRVVTWSTLNPTIVRVSSTGLVTGITAGAATIIASADDKTGTAAVIVTPAPVAAVSVTPVTPNIAVGQTVTLVPTLHDADGVVLVGRPVSWSSSTTAVATVSTVGVVTAVAPGTSTITAASEGRAGKANLTVSLIPVATVSISPSSASVTAGQTVTLTASTKDANGNALSGRTVAWSSSTQTVATVSATGVVTGVAAGTSVITATSEGKTATATATVTVSAVPAASVTVTPSSSKIVVAATANLTATVRDAAGNALSGRAVTWVSSKPAVATVSASGVVIGVAPGTATITATSGTVSGTATVSVALAPVAAVVVAPTARSLIVGATTTLVATTKDASNNTLTGRTITWTSGRQSVAKVSSAGVVTAVAVGTSTITARSEGKSGTATVTVTAVPVATVTITPPAVHLSVLATATLTATVRDAAGKTLIGRTVTWTTSNPLIALVGSSTGVVTGVLPGSATITATSEGKSGTASMTVALGPGNSVTVAPTTASIAAGGSTTFASTEKDLLGNSLSDRVVTWTSGTPSVATNSVVVGTTAPLTADASTITATNGTALTRRTVMWTSTTPTVATVSSSGGVTAVAVGTSVITVTV